MPRHLLLESAPRKLLEATMSQVGGSMRWQRENNGPPTSCMEVVMESDYEGIKISISRVESDKNASGNTTTGLLRMTSALRSVAHNRQHMS